MPDGRSQNRTGLPHRENRMPRKPASNWKFFPCQIGNDIAFIYVDVAAEKDIERAPTNLVKVRLTYKAPRPNGLPTSEEFEAARAIERSLERFARRGKDRYVGRITRGGYRLFFFYTRRKAKNAWGELLHQLAQKSGYELALTTKTDRRHAAYRKELYPTPDDWQVITDISVVELLRSKGDMEGVRRRIDHWAHFPNAKSAAKFVAWALAGPLKHDAKLSGVEEDGEHRVRLYHVGTTRQKELSHHSIQLNRKATELGGSYDGWETKLVTRKAATQS
jgi:hypothetical protein